MSRVFMAVDVGTGKRMMLPRQDPGEPPQHPEQAMWEMRATSFNHSKFQGPKRYWSGGDIRVEEYETDSYGRPYGKPLRAWIYNSDGALLAETVDLRRGS